MDLGFVCEHVFEHQYLTSNTFWPALQTYKCKAEHVIVHPPSIILVTELNNFAGAGAT